MGQPDEGFSLVQVFAIGLSFIAGIAIALGVVNAGGEQTASGPVAEAHTVDVDEIARAVVEPETPFEMEDDVVVEVAGVVCEVAQLTEGASSPDVLAAWNTAVESSSDACEAPFADTLGSDWVMTDAALSIFGVEGSLYEFSNSEGPVGKLTISLLVEDSLNGEANQLQSLISTIWPADSIDWERNCDSTDSAWSGLISPDGLLIEVTNCATA